jgi:hypothetical protein
LLPLTNTVALLIAETPEGSCDAKLQMKRLLAMNPHQHQNNQAREEPRIIFPLETAQLTRKSMVEKLKDPRTAKKYKSGTRA